MRFLVCTVVGLVLVTAAPAAQYPGKISPAFQLRLDNAPADEPIRVWIRFADKGGARSLADAERDLTPRARARRERNRVGIDVHDLPVAAGYIATIRGDGVRVRHASRWLNAISVEATPRQIERIAPRSFVRRVEPVRAFREPVRDVTGEPRATSPAPHGSTAFALDYGPSLAQNAQIHVPELHDQGLSGDGVLVAMLDAGFNNLSHDALVGLDILATWDFVNGDAIVSDQVGQAGSGNHGTYTLSAIGGFEPGDLIGPAYGATYILAKTENSAWERHIEEDDWIAGAEWADSIGADIISSSLGYATGFTNGEPSYSWSDMDGNTTIVALGADIAASRGILVVNSAGNLGWVSLPANTLVSPSDGDSVLAVGAVDASGVRASFSSVGPTSDGQLKPDVMACGVNVIAASPFGNVYTTGTGTSLSCPLVAGVAALLLELRPSATAMDIMDALRQTASRANTPDREYGYGIVNAAAAANEIVTAVGDTPRADGAVLHPAFPNPFNPATTIRYDLASNAHVTLSIFDVRGALVATLIDADEPFGSRSVQWNGNDRAGNRVASGVYVCRLTAGRESHAMKLVLLK